MLIWVLVTRLSSVNANFQKENFQTIKAHKVKSQKNSTNPVRSIQIEQSDLWTIELQETIM